MIVESRLRCHPGRIRLHFTRYVDTKRVAIYATMPDSSEPVATLTTNVPEIRFTDRTPDAVTLIKDYSENEGALQTLLEAGVVKSWGRAIPVGFTRVHPVLVLGLHSLERVRQEVV